MRRIIPEWICGPDDSLIDVVVDAGVAAVVALVATESLRSLIRLFEPHADFLSTACHVEANLSIV